MQVTTNNNYKCCYLLATFENNKKKMKIKQMKRKDKRTKEAENCLADNVNHLFVVQRHRRLCSECDLIYSDVIYSQ